MWLRLCAAGLVAAILFVLEVVVGRGGWPDAALLSLRLTRALIATFVGASLAVAGAALQALFQNPLADPYVLGTASGAAVGYAIGVLTGLAGFNTLSLPSMAGAVVALFAVYFLSAVRGRVSSGRMILAGVMVGFFSSSLVAVFMILARAEAVRTFYILWGNLGVVVQARDIPGLALAGLGIVLATIWLMAMSRHLDALSLGETEALSLGVDVEKVKFSVFAASGIIVGLSTAVVGAVGFVGLMVPHMARRLISPRHSLLLPGSALLGAGLVLGSDLVLRLVGFYQLPVGVLTSLLGVPFFIYLLRRSSWK